MKIICQILIYVTSCQGIIWDQIDNSWSINGWTAINGVSTNPYNPSTDITCQYNLLPFTNQNQLQQKSFTYKFYIRNCIQQTKPNPKIKQDLNLFSDIIVFNDQEKTQLKKLSLIGDGAIQHWFASVHLHYYLQMQYIQFININFPPNFQQFLGIFNGFSLSQYIDTQQLQQLLNYDLYNKPKQIKFNDLNANIFNNVSYIIFIVIITVMMEAFNIVVLKLMQEFELYLVNKCKILRIQTFKFITELQKLIFSTFFLFKQTGIYAIILTFIYDIQFAILLQITNQTFDSCFQVMNSMISYLFVIKYILTMIQPMKVGQFKNQNIWQSIFGSIKMLEAFLFQFSIILLQEFPQCQIAIISMNSLTFLLETSELNLLVQESALFISNISFNAYIYFPSQINQVFLGWFDVFVFLIMIIISLINTSYSTFLEVKKSDLSGNDI
ncbi:hypothetical protein pb186bvf_013845 [Paramecium bursaria]